MTWALLPALLTIVGAGMWTTAAHAEARFAEGTATTVAMVHAYWAGKGRSGFSVSYGVDGTPHEATLRYYDREGPRIGSRTRIEYATNDPLIIRTPGYDSADETWTLAVMTLVCAGALATCAVGWLIARLRADAGGDSSPVA